MSAYIQVQFDYAKLFCRTLTSDGMYRHLSDHGMFNPLKGRGVNWLHFAIQV